MQKIKLDKNTIIFCAVTIFLIGELLIALPGQFRRINDLSKKIAELAQQLDNIERDWPERDKYLNDKELLKKEIKEVQNKFVLPQQESKLLSFISTSSKDFEVTIGTFSPGSPRKYKSTKFGNFKYLPISISAQGKFHNLAMFLDFLQNSQYFFEITNLKITSGYPYHSVGMTICGLIQ